MAEPEANAASENLQETKLKRNGRICFLLILATMPGLCFTSVRLHVIKIGAARALRCEIEGLEDGTWRPREIKRTSETPGAHEECFIYNYDYGTLTNKTSEGAKKILDKGDANRKICSKFVAIGDGGGAPKTYAKEFASYCESISHEMAFDIVAALSQVAGCLLLVPFADVYGRKRILAMGCDLALFSAILKIIFLDYTREQLGELIINFAYPAMKYTTQALVLETAGNTLGPLSLVLISVGMHIPPLIAGIMPPVSVHWKCLHLIALSPVLTLRLLTWYCPESAAWFVSIKETKQAQIVAQFGDDPRRCNEHFLASRNRKGRFRKINALFQEFARINRAEFILINVLAGFVGFLSFYSYSKHKLMYRYLGDSISLRLLNVSSGLLAVLLAIPCAYLKNGAKFSVALMFLGPGVLYLFLAQNSSTPTNFSTAIIIISCTEATTSALQILYEFYIQQIFPTSHRCLCTGFCGATMGFGLLLVIIAREFNEILSHIINSGVCLIGCILSVFLIKNLKRTQSLVSTFSDAEMKMPKTCLGVCCINIK